MADTTNEPEEDEVDVPENKPKQRLRDTDLTDSEHDQERMQPEEAILDLPDVNEIPGQEHIHVPRIREMQDVTISSDDEEGVGVFGDEEDEDEITRDSDSNIDELEQGVLEKSTSDMPDEDDDQLRRAELDQTDEEGDPLNEGSTATDVSGGDLDTSGVDSDDAMENIGEEDEENNQYSLGGDDNEHLEEDRAGE